MIPTFSAAYFHRLIADANSRGRPHYFEEGVYTVRVDNAYFFLNRNRRARAAVECTLVSSSNPNLPSCSSASWIVALDSDAGPAALRGFIECITPTITPSEIGRIFPEKTEVALSEAAGSAATVIARTLPTRSGGAYTKLEWQSLKLHGEKNVKTS